MKKCIMRFFIAALAFITFCSANAQNLIPNPGFEQYAHCPSTISLFAGNVAGWDCPTSLGSPDYFNACCTTAEAGVPYNTFGYQWSHRGNGMAGIIAWEATYNTNGTFSDAFSEYIEAKLLQPMQAGKTYCVTFFVNNGVNPSKPNPGRNYIALDEIGIHFSSAKVQNNAARTLNLPYHIVNSQGRYISDTSIWTKVSTTYKATGNEQWMTLGVFTNGSNPPRFIKMDPNATGNDYFSYLYIDDIDIEELSADDTVKSAFDSLYCNSSALPMDIKSKRLDGIYKWNNGSTNNALTISEPGTYWCLSYTNCKWYADTFHVKYDPNGLLNLGKEAVNCNNSPVVLKPRGSFRNLIWSTGEQSDSIIADRPGKYFLTATNDCGTQTDTVEVFIQDPTPAPLTTDTTICETATEPKLQVQGENLMWYTSTFSTVGYDKQPPVNTSLLGTRIYYVSQTIGKCESDRVPMRIYVKYKPKDELETLSDMCERYRDTIGKQLPDVQYRWNTGYNYCCMVPSRPGLYTVAVSNECGVYTDTVNVTFSFCDTCVQVPTVFTPNNDGINDKFKGLVYCPVADYHLVVYNRWGNKLFESNNTDEGWNGRVNGLISDNGAYVYIITYRSGATGNPKMMKGQFMLLR